VTQTLAVDDDGEPEDERVQRFVEVNNEVEEPED
jgi:hypothetical protein